MVPYVSYGARSSAPYRQSGNRAHVVQVFHVVDFGGQAIAFGRGQHAVRVLVKLGAQLRGAHRVLGRTQIMFLCLLDHAPVVKRDAQRPLESARTRKIGIDVVAVSYTHLTLPTSDL